MTDWLLKTAYAEIIEHVRSMPPLVIDGETFQRDRVMREIVNFKAHQMVEWIEGHGETRH